jgi:hypothetical protein
VNESDPTWQNSLDIIIPQFTISAMEKTLFKDASLQVTGSARSHPLYNVVHTVRCMYHGCITHMCELMM